MLKLKYFSIEEAEALLPELTRILTRALELKGEIEKKVEQWRRVAKTLSDVEQAITRSRIDFLAVQIETELNKVTALGGVPKDLERGLVDFPARIDNREGYLCWELGEKKIAYWHGLTEGFQGRKPLQSEGRKRGK